MSGLATQHAPAALAEFQPFPSIARLNREWIASEKIDGTNALVYVDEEGHVRAGSRSKWITRENDNFGFARWVEANSNELTKLGPGYHYGEWWGSGIQRGYGLTEKRFSLFNSHRWSDDSVRPACCGVVPVLARGVKVGMVEDVAIVALQELGSIVAPGFMRPEGIVLFHAASGQLFKVTLEKDEQPKGQVRL